MTFSRLEFARDVWDYPEIYDIYDGEYYFTLDGGYIKPVFQRFNNFPADRVDYDETYGLTTTASSTLSVLSNSMWSTFPVEGVRTSCKIKYIPGFNPVKFLFMTIVPDVWNGAGSQPVETMFNFYPGINLNLVLPNSNNPSTQLYNNNIYVENYTLVRNNPSYGYYDTISFDAYLGYRDGS